MALIMNTDLEDVKVQAFGNWFYFKAGQVKLMDDRISRFLVTDKPECGFMELPEICNDDPNSPEAKQAKEEAIKSGRQKIITNLMRVVKNLEVSLQRDLDVAGIKTSNAAFASDGEMDAYKKLAKFKDLEADENIKRQEEIAKLKEKISGSTNKSNAK